MTSDEAISIMNVIVHMIEPQYDTDRIEDAVEMAIKALEQEPCGDCISRDAVMHILDEVGGDFDSPREAVVPIDYIADMVSELPFVTAQPKMGYWEWVQYDSNPNIGNWHCSECRTIIPHMPEETDNTPIYKWCPMCGAKMSEIPTGAEGGDKE